MWDQINWLKCPCLREFLRRMSSCWKLCKWVQVGADNWVEISLFGSPAPSLITLSPTYPELYNSALWLHPPPTVTGPSHFISTDLECLSMWPFDTVIVTMILLVLKDSLLKCYMLQVAYIMPVSPSSTSQCILSPSPAVTGHQSL